MKELNKEITNQVQIVKNVANAHAITLDSKNTMEKIAESSQRFGTGENAETISSLEIAKITGKDHAHVMRDIRNMEPAWEKIRQSKFGLSSYKQPLPNGGFKDVPCYELTKVECLYIATKYNDEARAKLILRWEQLEKERAQAYQVPSTFREALLLAAEQQEKIEEQQRLIEQNNEQILQLSSAVVSMEKKVTYLDKILACPSTVKVKTIAQDYGMSAIAFNLLLHDHGIQYKCGDVWVLYAKYLPEGYVKDVPFEYTRTNGTTGMASNMQWTQKGRMFLYEFLKEKGILPLIERV